MVDSSTIDEIPKLLQRDQEEKERETVLLNEKITSSTIGAWYIQVQLILLDVSS